MRNKAHYYSAPMRVCIVTSDRTLYSLRRSLVSNTPLLLLACEYITPCSIQNCSAHCTWSSMPKSQHLGRARLKFEFCKWKLTLKMHLKFVCIAVGEISESWNPAVAWKVQPHDKTGHGAGIHWSTPTTHSFNQFNAFRFMTWCVWQCTSLLHVSRINTDLL